MKNSRCIRKNVTVNDYRSLVRKATGPNYKTCSSAIAGGHNEPAQELINREQIAHQLRT